MLSIVGHTSSNVGQVLGDSAKGVIKNIAIFSGKFTEAQTADASAIEAALAAASRKPKSDGGKLYWLPEVLNFEDRAEQNTTGALNLGPTVMLKEGKNAYEIRVSGTSEFAKAMRRWNNLNVGVLEYDSNRKLWGRRAGSDFYGYTAQLFVNQMKVASGQAPEEGIVTITVSFQSSEEYGNQGKMLDLGTVDTSLIKMQVDAEFKVAAAASGANHKLHLGVPLAGMNKTLDMVAYFGATIANKDLFVAKTGVNFGTTLAITTVVINAAGYLDVTFDATAYAALAPGAKIQLQGVSPDALEAAGITDIEVNPIVLTK